MHHFLRVSAFLHAAGLRMGLCWAAYFDDFAVLTHECHEKSSLHAALGLFDILGFQYSADKLSPFSDVTELLGVEIDLTEVTGGFVKVQNKKSRVDETVDFLEKMLAERVLVVSEMPSKLGKLQYAEAQLWEEQAGWRLLTCEEQRVWAKTKLQSMTEPARRSNFCFIDCPVENPEL